MRSIQPTVIRYSTDVGLYAYMLSIYRYMGLGLALTGAVAMGFNLLPLAMRQSLSFLPTLGLFGTMGIALSMGFLAHRLRASTAQLLFWSYATFMGLGLSRIFTLYTQASLGMVFLVTAVSFAALSFYGQITRRDLSSLGSFAFMGLVGIIVAGFINIFLQSSILQFAVSVISVFVFSMLIAFNTQELKEMYYSLPADQELRQKMSIFGALNLYTNVINLFLSLLHLFGERKDR